METKTKMICFSTLFMLLAAVTTISFTYTNFVQAELKEDVADIKKALDAQDDKNQITNEKITNLQIQTATTNTKLDTIIKNQESQK